MRAGIRHPASPSSVTPRRPGSAVMSSTGRSIGRERERRVDVGAAREHEPRLARQDRERVLQRGRGGSVRRELAGDADRHGQAATLGRTSLARSSRFARVPVERVEHEVVDAAEGLDLRADPVRDLLGLARAGSSAASSRGPCPSRRGTAARRPRAARRAAGRGRSSSRRATSPRAGGRTRSCTGGGRPSRGRPSRRWRRSGGPRSSRTSRSGAARARRWARSGRRSSPTAGCRRRSRSAGAAAGRASGSSVRSWTR